MGFSMKKFGLILLLCSGVIVWSSRDYATTTPAPIGANVFVDLAKKIVPSVVNISTLSIVKSLYGMGGPDDLFRRFFEDFFRRHGGGNGGGGGGGEEDEETPPRPGPSGKAPKAMSLGT